MYRRGRGRGARRQMKRYRYLLRSARRLRIPTGKANGDTIEAKLKERTPPLSPEDVPDSVAVAQRVISENQDFEVFLHARTVENDGTIGLKIISVYQIALPFQISALTRYFHMRKEVVDGRIVRLYDYGLAQPGPFTPLSPRQQKKYSIVKMSGEESEITISNNVDSDKLFLRIQKKQKRVVVARNPGKNSQFDVQRLDSGYYVFKTVAIPGCALKYTTTKTIIVEEYKPANSDFQFKLESQTSKQTEMFPLVF